jgi:uncharacterized heparinase superfamily protein
LKLGRLFHTVRYLRPVQIYGRLWLRTIRPRPDVRPAPPVRTPSGSWIVRSWREPSLVDENTFRFLNVSCAIANPRDWDSAERSKLWRYNLHYFDDLTAANAPDRTGRHRALLARWIAENPPPVGTGWEPYPTSLRIVNWIKWSLNGGGSRGLDEKAIASLAIQARWLRKRLEVHLLGNHLWANGKALVFAGAFFDDSEADEWLRKGSAILERELGEQVLGDGGHFEQSPMYHAILLEDVLDLVNLDRAFPSRLPPRLLARLREVAPRMLRWLEVMSHPDGKISFFNDAALGVAPDFAWLRDTALRLGLEVVAAPLRHLEHLAESGYVRLDDGRAVVICDMASVGPDYLPGHAHADTLSFEMSIDGKRVFVNSGTGTYDSSAQREFERSTAAHNTVVVNGENSSEVWASFRVARRARPFDVRTGTDEGGLWVEGSHDGYRRLRPPVVHRRRIEASSHEVKISDHVSAVQPAVANLYLHPDFSSAGGTGAAVTFHRADGHGRVSVSTDAGAGVNVQPSTWRVEFGKQVSNLRLILPFSDGTLMTRITWGG